MEQHSENVCPTWQISLK